MYNSPVQYFKTVPCKDAADALLWLKVFLDKICSVLSLTLQFQFLSTISLVYESCKPCPSFYFCTSSTAVSTNFHLKTLYTFYNL